VALTAGSEQTVSAGQLHQLTLTPFDDQANRQDYSLGAAEEEIRVTLSGPLPPRAVLLASFTRAVLRSDPASGMTFSFERNLTVAGTFNVTLQLTPRVLSDFPASRSLHRVRACAPTDSSEPVPV
jgi:hypothetical protein